MTGTPAARITVVEDDSAIAEILHYNLEQAGFEVAIEPNRDLALAAIRRRPPDLILLDLMLPGLDGLEITRWLKRDAATADIPLIILTARDGEIDSRWKKIGISLIPRAWGLW